MDDATRERKLNKIRKCLRLSKSAEAHEAAAAIRQAQAMMRELGIEEDEIGNEPTTGEVIITKEAFGGSKYLQELVNLIRRAFGVDAVYEDGNGISRTRANVRYIGPQSRVMMAIYTHRVIDRAIFHAWKKVRDMFDQAPGARMTFRLQFLDGIDDKVERLAPTPPESKAIDRYKKAQYTELTRTKTRQVNAYDEFAASLGARAASEFDIHRPMEGDKQRKLGHG